MTDNTHDVFESGIAVLTDATTTTPDGSTVSGVAIGEDDVTNGLSGQSTRWPADVLRDASDLLEGIPIVKDHPGVEKDGDALTVDAQAPIDAKVGEVTDARYQDGVGLLWKGVVADDSIAEKIEAGLAQVSPVVARSLGDPDDDGVRDVQEVKAFRDLGVVSKGAAPSNNVEAGDGAMATALMADALSSAFDAGDDGAGTGGAESPADDSPDGAGGSDDPAGASSSGRDSGVDALASLTAEQVGLVETAIQEFVDAQGDASVGDLQEWLWNMDDELDPNVRTALDAALDDFHDEWSSNEQVVSESFAEWLADQADTDITIEAMTDDTITDEERALLDQVDDPADAADALAERDRFDDPHLLETEDYEALTEDLDEAKQVFAEALSERVGMDAEKIAEHFSFEALREEFEDDDGELTVDALTQHPETGDPDDADPDTGYDALTDDELEEARQAKSRIEHWDGKNDTIADAERDALTELVGADSFDDVDMEAI